MRDLIRIALVMALAFASTFLIAEATGILPEGDLLAWLEALREVDPRMLALAVIGMLVLDLFIAVPTMTTILLAGWLLGPWVGGLVSSVGLLLMGSTAYALGRGLGRRVLARLFQYDARLAGIEAAFARNDILTLAVCQALPILPELSASIAGIASLHPLRFLAGYALGVVPFAFIVASGGAASTPDDLRPAILTAIGTSAALLILWRLVARKQDS
ncbi:MAG: DedA family protein [Rhodobacterales bacterium]|nr:MAG: DedA family protein [Rhodobacterales bacterium]